MSDVGDEYVKAHSCYQNANSRLRLRLQCTCTPDTIQISQWKQLIILFVARDIGGCAFQRYVVRTCPDGGQTDPSMQPPHGWCIARKVH